MIESHADSQWIWMNGKFVAYDDARVHVLSHSLHYGTAAFEGIRAYATTDGGAAIFRAECHYKRLLDSIRPLGYKTTYSARDLVGVSTELLRRNGFRDCYLRPIAYLDDGVRGLKLPADPTPLFAIASWKWGQYLGDDSQKRGIRAIIASQRRSDISTSMPFAKLSGGYLGSVLARREATMAGVEEAILLDPLGFVAEGSGENIFVIKDGVLTTPPSGFILPGLTRESVMQIARDSGYTVREANITRNELYLADELFFTGTAVEITPVREVDRHTIGAGEPGPITRKLSDVFFRTLRGEVPKYKGWLTSL